MHQPTINLPIGAEVTSGGVRFRIWAPKSSRANIVYADERKFPLSSDDGGHFSGVDPNAKAGATYWIELDDGGRYPDPASRFQPEGVFGASQIVDPSTFRWSDEQFSGVSETGQVLYEMHIGTFTPAGTWRGAIERLPFLKDMGITCIELMPVSAFAGRFGWGYDGVHLFAPTQNYGSPDEMRQFVDAAHRHGIGVILDVVYNHFGPSGNFLHAFTDHFTSDKHKNDWGSGINFDGENSHGVREFYIANARYWITEFHLDGFRFDATQAIVDDSDDHILAALCREARKAAPHKSIYLIGENEPQDTRLVRPAEHDGYGMDALWNDDFHHSAIVAITGRNEAYYTDHAGHPQEFLSALKWGFLFQGQMYRWQNKRRGTPSLDLPSTAFVHYIQNHDQIANYGDGRRLQNLTSPGLLRAITSLLLLSPQTPMLFQGQEFGCSCNFNYFAEHGPELNKLICDGRRKEIMQFGCFKDERFHEQIPDPCDENTFAACKLRWDELDQVGNARVFRLHRDLIALRKELPFFRSAPARGEIDGAILDGHVFCVRYMGRDCDDFLMIVNLWNDVILHSVPEPLVAPPAGKRWATRWSSEDPAYGGLGVTPVESLGESWRLAGEQWRIPGYSTTLLHPVEVPK